MNDVDPQAWLADILARLAGHPAQQIDELLPLEVARRRRAGAGGLTLRRECPDVGGDVTSCAHP